jgi:1-pyrroline-5-carboxylate dehydrogenase
MSPMDGQLLLNTHQTSDASMVDRAVRLANAAAPGWARRSTAERTGLLQAFAKRIAEQRHQLAMASLYEVGKSRIEAIGEAEEAVDIPNYYASELEKQNGYNVVLNQARAGESTRSVLVPFGTFAVIAPFNFPIALSVNMISAAIAMGNTVVYKPAPGCELSGSMIVTAALAAGIPRGVISMVLGDSVTGHALANHAGVDGVAFTGSHEVGMRLARDHLALAFAKPVIAEMGGKNPAYVTAEADLAVAAEGVARSAFGLQGQKCSACSVVYVEESVSGRFLGALRSFTARLKVGDPRCADTFMGAVQTQATVDRYAAAIEQGRKEGTLHAGGQRITAGSLGRGFFVEPAMVELSAASSLTREELFMPFLVIRPVPSLKEGIAEGNAVRYGLAAGIYTKSRQELDYFLSNAQAGVLYANRASGATTGAWPGIQSFCGWKGSGVTGKGGLGPHFLPLFAREQSHTIIM